MSADAGRTIHNEYFSLNQFVNVIEFLAFKTGNGALVWEYDNNSIDPTRIEDELRLRLNAEDGRQVVVKLPLYTPMFDKFFFGRCVPRKAR